MSERLHFYDIECLDNIFTLTNYLPEENTVEQYYLASDDLQTKIDENPNLLETLTKRVNLRNNNFNPHLQTESIGHGKVRLYDLHTVEGNLHLAETFGLSDAHDANNPYDYTSHFPMKFRFTCDTDLLTKNNFKYNKENVVKNYQNFALQQLVSEKPDQRLSDHGKLTKEYVQYDYHYFDSNRDPYLLGYNSKDYDLTLLAIYMQETFHINPRKGLYSAATVDNETIFAPNEDGGTYISIIPPDPHTLRQINNRMFKIEKDGGTMSSILYRYRDYKDKNLENMDLSRASQIKRNWLKSGRHLDVAKLNEKMSQIGLKRLLGMLGYQILESDKLKPGTDRIDNFDQFLELMAYNASDCINLYALYTDRHNFYSSQFALKKSLLKTYPMTVYKKQADDYAPEISPGTVKNNRITIDSSSAIIATNVVCPYGHLDDIAHVSFIYPETRKARDIGEKQFNVLKQTREFFQKRVYEPALKYDKPAAEKALKSFNRIMDFYAYIQGKNFNDSVNYYQKQLAIDSYSKSLYQNARPQIYKELFAGINYFDIALARQMEKEHSQNLDKWHANVNYKNKYGNTYANNYNTYPIPYKFIIANKIYKLNLGDSDSNSVKLSDLVAFIRNHNLNSPLIQQIMTIYNQNKHVNGILVETFKTLANLVDEYLAKVLHLTNIKLNIDAVHFSQHNKVFLPIDVLTFNDKFTPVYKLGIRPYKPSDLPIDNYCLPFFDKKAHATSGYALFSIGGVHGAEYNQKLYAEQKTKHTHFAQFDLLDKGQNLDKTELNKQYVLFKPNQSGAYELNKLYTYTSIGMVNHEDFSSYYPSLCRMLNVYWNNGIGKDIYGEVYDRKEELGVKMKDPKYSKEQRAIYKTMRQGTKLILNATTGKGDSHGQNSPIQMNNNIISMRLIGQMFTWRIGQAQALVGARVVSTNTDGLYTILHDTELNDKILANESAEIKVRIDPERTYLITKDANNRIEATYKEQKVTVDNASGGDLGAYNGPTPTARLSHPAAIDRALGLYLCEVSNPDSKYFDERLQNRFDRKLGMHFLNNLIGDVSSIEDNSERLTKKHELLNYFQNIVSSNPGSDRYIFTTHKYFENPNSLSIKGFTNDMKIQTEEQTSPAQNTQQMNLFNVDSLVSENTEISVDDIDILQHYNRVFYVKDDSPYPDRHLYVAAGKTIPEKDMTKRKKNSEPLYNNSDLAVYTLRKYGLNIQKDLNNNTKEAQIVKQPSLPPEFKIFVMNKSLASLNEEETNMLLNNLDMDKYLSLLESKYITDWSNNQYYVSAWNRANNIVAKAYGNCDFNTRFDNVEPILKQVYR